MHALATATRVDAGLARRLQERDRTAWDEVYAEYGPRLRAFAFRLAGNAHDADDLVQETFVRALPRLDRLDPDRLELGPYLFTTLRNTFLTRIERDRRVTSVDEVPEPDAPSPIELDPERRALLGGQREEVQIANARLAPRQRLVLALRELEDLSYAEIGEIVGLKENAVAQLISRARESLRNELRLVQVDPERIRDECREFLPLLSRHLDGQLRGDQFERTLAHLGACERCQDALASMREASRRYRTFVPPLSSDDAHAQSIDAELAAAGYWDPRRRRALLRGARVGALAGVAALAVIGATGVGAARLVVGGAPEPAALTAELTSSRAPTAPFVPPPPPVVGTTVRHHSTPAEPHLRRVRRTRNAVPAGPAPSRATHVKTSRRDPPAAKPTAPTRAALTPPKPHAKAPPTPKIVQPVAPTVSTTTETIPPPDTTPPAATIDSASTNMGEASFSFSSSEPDSTFQCALDGGAFEPCTSPKAYGALAYGSHTFAVHATDAAGNTGPDATHAWTYAQPLPDLVVSNLTETSFTVANSGAAPAGPFVVSVTLIGTFSFGGLAPGESATRVWSACRLGTLNAIADRGGTVAESDETNNARTLVSDC